MGITEYNEAETMRLFFEEGIEKGMQIGSIKTLVGLGNDGIISNEIAAERLNLSLDEFFMKKEQYKKQGECSVPIPLSVKLTVILSGVLYNVLQMRKTSGFPVL